MRPEQELSAEVERLLARRARFEAERVRSQGLAAALLLWLAGNSVLIGVGFALSGTVLAVKAAAPAAPVAGWTLIAIGVMHAVATLQGRVLALVILGCALTVTYAVISVMFLVPPTLLAPTLSYASLASVSGVSVAASRMQLKARTRRHDQR